MRKIIQNSIYFKEKKFSESHEHDIGQGSQWTKYKLELFQIHIKLMIKIQTSLETSCCAILEIKKFETLIKRNNDVTKPSKDTYPDDLLATVFQAVINDVKLAPADIGDICIGNVGDERAAATARFAQFYSNIPETVPIFTTNRQCSSGLQAVLNVAGLSELSGFLKAVTALGRPFSTNYPGIIDSC
ncbi:hypothetical protein LOTGIDRAFT_176627 [Lottia gigantea]|uniref:acetyl-CoA C-acetyltransferase n=1 Tax=Lottia gigantea TaxID=225164 RepID=V4AN61_LOTGI|nr:hypothetical protein LOTGIDRAFT_176627 [Lottia gigantea]ESO96215.1 hypothetical protein LOTGIDRAFT_176627 [Lottia gigantea]